MNKTAGSLIAGLFLVCTAASAEERRPVGEATQQLMELQKSGAQASAQPHPVQGEVAKRSHQRYLQSFEHDIPVSFKQEGTR